MGQFISMRGMANSKASEAAMNAIRRRRGQEHHPIRQIVCGCGPDCGAFHIIDTSVDMRTIQLKRTPKAFDTCVHFK